MENLYDAIQASWRYKIEKKIITKPWTKKEFVNTIIYRNDTPLVVEHMGREITIESILNTLYRLKLDHEETLKNKNKHIEALQKDLDAIRNIVSPWWDTVDNDF